MNHPVVSMSFKGQTKGSQASFLSFGVKTHDSGIELLDYIKGFVYDKGGQCLKTEIIQTIMLNLVDIGINVDDGLKRYSNEPTFGDNWSPFSRGGMTSMKMKMTKLHEKLEEFENGDFYMGTGLSIETSRLTGRKIYKYVEPIEEDYENLIDLCSDSELYLNVSDSEVSEFSRRVCFSDTSKPYVFDSISWY